MTVLVRRMSIDDYASVLALWKETEGIGLNESDSEAATAAFLARNPGMSAVAAAPEGEIVGAVLCGYDGRRGYLHHLAVARAHRGRGIAARLLAWCHQELAARGIPKCNVFLYADNAAGASFWEHNGWSPRPDLRVLQKPLA